MKLMLAWMVGGALSAFPLLLGEIDPATFDLPLQLVMNLGGMGFVVWFAWYTVTKSQPSLAQTYNDGLEKAFGEAKAARDDYRAQVDRILTSHEKSAAEIRAGVAELAKAVSEMVGHCRQRQMG